MELSSFTNLSDSKDHVDFINRMQSLSSQARGVYGSEITALSSSGNGTGYFCNTILVVSPIKPGVLCRLTRSLPLRRHLVSRKNVLNRPRVMPRGKLFVGLQFLNALHKHNLKQVMVENIISYQLSIIRQARTKLTPQAIPRAPSNDT
jgi:hypothetical protein